MLPRLAPFQVLKRQSRFFMCEQTAKISSTSPAAKLVDNPRASSGFKLSQLTTSSHNVTENLSKQMWSPAVREQRRAEKNKLDTNTKRRVQNNQIANNYLRHMPRRWNQGELYSPHDLSPEEVARFRKPTRPKFDVIDVMGINPLDEYQNFSMISEYMTPMGRIRHPKDTCLRPVNQRKIAKAIRRAVGLGLHPSVHHHPELLKHRYANFASVGRRAP